MATSTWTTPAGHFSDVAFRAWGLELNQEFGNIGLIQTADTGQINWTTVVRASINSDAGFEIWRFNDSFQSTAPIFFRINYGTASTTTRPRITFQFGTGSDGSGTLTGLTSTTIILSGGIDTGTTPLTSYLSHQPGFLALIWKTDSIPSISRGGFIIHRSNDLSGQFNTKGAFILAGNGSTSTSSDVSNQSFSFEFSTAFVFSNGTGTSSFVPGNQTTLLSNNAPQLYFHWILTPKVLPLIGLTTSFNSEIGKFSTFTSTLFGSTPHTYLNVAKQIGEVALAADQSLYGLSILWE